MSETEEEKKIQKPPRKGKWKKILLTVSATLAAIVVLLLIFRDGLVTLLVPVIGSRVTGTPVAIEKFSSSLFSGKVELRGLKVGNPKGYNEPNALEIGSIQLKLKPASLLSSKIEVEHLLIDKTVIALSFSAVGKNNLWQLNSNLGKFAGEKASGKSTGDSPEKSGKQVVIRLFRFSEGSLVTSVGIISGSLCLPLGTVTLRDLGENGSLRDSWAEICTAIGKSMSDALKLSGASMDAFKSLGGSFADGGKTVIKHGGKIFKKIQKLFKK